MEGIIKFIVRLTVAERAKVEGLVNRGKVGAERRKRANILLKADASPEGLAWCDSQIAAAVEVSLATIHRTRQTYVEQGLEDALERTRPTGRHYRKLDGAQEAKLVTIACSPAPQGRARWTIKLLADKLVELEIVDSIAEETVRQTLKKTTSSRG